MIEIWKDIPDTHGNYQASNYGKIRSRLRVGSMGLKKDNPSGWLQKKLSINNMGYHIVQLCVNGKPKTYLAHRLIAKTFLPNPQNLPEVNHLDFNKLNNCISNLEWESSSKNIHHAQINGRYNIQDRTIIKRKCKVTAEIVKEIRSGKLSGKDYAEIYGISKSLACGIKKGKRWKHVA